ncbi:MAG: hypothetical protein A3H88_00015 [Candidatus Blackburnbacteria bacterium RIFCSPLOWO2_02_FULL_44_9]|uniref:Uncharacterized protein n=1 Tax=Candidatus Blackburnbacteria bacterium RIFCSPHIGHO2_02_FULL_44_20 TaxID=1797516 RepID=A0A1G1V7C0_9BACT|nr:MAG: hypothetical protein A3E16_03550 [Candidatus Blackburnbacteria bacterium RIFCSPHIGHO2_12_FULL_44_25]OGY11227.1 MAG: hypothetical protein A3D26_04275 [Candidatus Blackburnbacteria bacterium RIFCSPHIGHO2_02_FULL_44_20]OGY14425.1 MAG: hypothetical protein A3A62_00475 [Candidatus Blackburnbacteria bacterium RIFCSPLOWO2_01_FULL_44_43]OGY17041.1 MAG: hypothetical protein A3H88_00015 [Candidatus Blackburnbacteria bacterium RIFCSPLOWO2_02_FULL_44_9]
MLTQADFNEVEQLVKEVVREEIKHLPTKDEFFTKMDEVVGRLQKIEQELTVVAHQTKGHEDRITGLEKIHPQSQHA